MKEEKTETDFIHFQNDSFDEPPIIEKNQEKKEFLNLDELPKFFKDLPVAPRY